jgi:hypothetical protein
VLIRCQSYHTDYACSYGGAVVSSGDGMNSSTQVSVVRCAWVPVTMSHHARHSMPLSPEDPGPAALPDTKKPPGMTARGLGTTRVGLHRGSTVDR